MGYTTSFDGFFHLDRRLFDTEVLYLLAFSETRHFKRNVELLKTVPDSARAAVALPLGEEGCYFVNHHWDRENDYSSALDYNRPPKGQPSLWCQWVPTANGGGIEWDGQEKFYHYIAWLQYLILHFLEPWGYQLSGVVKWQGEERDDRGIIQVEQNQLILPPDQNFLQEATTPIKVPPQVFAGLEAAFATDPTLIYSWLATLRAAEQMDYPETANWIQTNLREYILGVERGFAPEPE